MKPKSIQKEQRSSPEYYFSLLPDSVKSSLNEVQQQAVLEVLKRAIRVPSHKILDVETSFFFFKHFYLTIYLGRDLRRRRRHFTRRRDWWASFLIKMGIYLSLAVIAALFIFMALYLIKSALGIDLFPNFHLRDLWS